MSKRLIPRSGKRTEPTNFLFRLGDDAHPENKRFRYVIRYPEIYRKVSLERPAKKDSKQSDAVFDAATAVRMLENPTPASAALLDILALD